MKKTDCQLGDIFVEKNRTTIISSTWGVNARKIFMLLEKSGNKCVDSRKSYFSVIELSTLEVLQYTSTTFLYYYAKL